MHTGAGSEPNPEAAAPSLDFAGANRPVPWVSWSEPHSHTGEPTQIFAMTDDLAERIRKIGGQTLKSIGQIAQMKKFLDYDAYGDSEDVVGKALIVHAKADDFKTQPTGDAGGRVACGVIKKD